MLNKKNYLFKWLLLSLIIISCNNSSVSEKLEVFESKLHYKEIELKYLNSLQPTLKTFKFNEVSKSVKNLYIEPKTSQNIKLVSELDKSLTIPLKNKNLISAPIIEKEHLQKLKEEKVIFENSYNISKSKVKEKYTTDNVSIDLDVVNKIQRKKNKNLDKVKLYKKGVKFSEETYKVATLLPLTGKSQRIGQEIMMGVENAYFSNLNKNIEIKFFDTNSLSNDFFDLLNKQELDLIIGPFFSNKIIAINSRVKNINIPVLSFSNNKSLNYKNVWLLGKILEDEISNIIDFGIKTGIKSFAIFGDSSQYSKTLIKTAQKELNKISISHDIFEIRKEILNDRKKLRDEIKKISGWSKENNKKLVLPKPKYDGILFTGSKNFILKISPLLSYYDLGPERVTYLGNSQFNNDQLIEELSLQGSFFSSSEESKKIKFIKTWEEKWGFKPSFLNILASDLTNFANKLHSQQSVISYITRNNGHNWVSGKIFITNDGYNKRNQIVKKIENKSLTKVYAD